MKKYFFASLVLAFSTLILGQFSWAQCPEDTVDHGNCDTLTVTCLDCEQTPGTGPWHVRFPLLVTHDQTETIDSIAGFVIPLGWTRTNPAAYCSLDAYWNTSDALWVFPGFPRSIFRHMLNDADPTDTLMHNRMAQMAADFSNREWDTRIVDVKSDYANDSVWARMSLVATGTQDQRWWEGDRVLLATLTYVIEDTMTICMDSAFWPPTNRLLWSRADGVTYVPRDNLPHCFTVGVQPAPDFTIDADPDADTVLSGGSANYTVTLTSLGGFNSPCTLTVTGLPTGAAADFVPNPVTPTNTSVMTVTTTGATPDGTYDLTITAAEQTKIEHSTQVALTVMAAEDVVVTAPDGGEEWCGGDSEDITWTSSSIDTVKIEYSTNGGGNWTTEVEKFPAAGGSYSWTIPDAPSANCLVRICDAKDSTPCDQSDAAFTIRTLPSAPSECVASEDSCDKVRLTWIDNSDNEIRFYVYRNGAIFDSVGADVESYDDLTASPGTTYRYCVTAFNQCGQSDSCCDDGTRQAPPAHPTGCLASDTLCDKVSFTWTDASDNESGFIIYRGGSALDTVDAGVTLYDDLSATPGQTYSYGVSAYNDCGESSQCNDNGTRQTQPAAPTDCAASDDLCDKVHFSWTDQADNETGFYIYRDGAKLDSVGADVEEYDDAAASPGTTYRYCVSAYNQCGESDSCCNDGIRQSPPLAPTDCVASDDLCDKVHFTWNDNSDNEIRFYIYRDGAMLDSVDADGEEYDDAAASPGTTYRYCVSAYNGCGESDSCCHDGIRQAPPAAPTDLAASENYCDKVALSWTDNSGDEDGFYIYRNADKLDSVGVDVQAYEDFTAATGIIYRYCVSAYKACGESDSSCDDGSRKLPPTAPTDCAATDDLCDTVQLTWTDQSDDEQGFVIYREGAVLDSVGEGVSFYDDLTAASGNTYRYCVSAYNECGESDTCCDDGTMLPQGVTVTAPNGGEEWIVGSSHDITWTSDCLDSVRLEYSTDAGSNWSTETTSTPAGPGSYSWTIPDAPSDQCLVRICDSDDGSPCDTSDVVFSIQAKDFAIEVRPDTLTLRRGMHGSYEVKLTSINGFSSTCTLEVSGLPGGSESGFGSPTLVPTDSTELDISLADTNTIGYYTLTITATEMDRGKALEHSKNVTLEVTDDSGVDDWTDNTNRPERCVLFQNHPNPFNPETKISYFLPKPSYVKLTVYNVLGQRVRTLFDGHQDSGTHTVLWDGKREDGTSLSSGIYFYRMQADDFRETKKMSLMK